MVIVVSAADFNCIIPQQMRDSYLIFDDDNTTCQRLDIEPGVVSTKLQVKTSCVNTAEVSYFSNKISASLLFSHLSFEMQSYSLQNCMPSVNIRVIFATFL